MLFYWEAVFRVVIGGSVFVFGLLIQLELVHEEPGEEDPFSVASVHGSWRVSGDVPLADQLRESVARKNVLE